MSPTPLDEALIAVHESQDAAEEVRDQAEDQYYELFLNTTLYVPTWDTAEPVKIEDDGDEISIQPVIIEDESGEENKTYIMIFDSEQRLNQWADGQEVGIAELLGHDVISVLGSANYLILNPSSECSKEFYPEELEWLKSIVVENIED